MNVVSKKQQVIWVQNYTLYRAMCSLSIQEERKKKRIPLKTTLTPYWPYTTCSRLGTTWDLNDGLVMDKPATFAIRVETKGASHKFIRLSFKAVPSKQMTYLSKKKEE